MQHSTYQPLYHSDMVSTDPAVAASLIEASHHLRQALASVEAEEACIHERVESLRTALREVDALAVAAPAATVPDAPVEQTGTNGRPTQSPGQRSSAGPRRHRTADAIQDLIASEPRPWGIIEVIETLSSSSTLAGLESPSMAIRAAIRRMESRGDVVRVARGQYRTAGAEYEAVSIPGTPESSEDQGATSTALKEVVT